MSLLRKHPSIIFSMLAFFITVSSWVYIAGSKSAAMNEMEKDIEEVKRNTEEDHDTIIEIGMDVKWIKENLKQK